MIPLISLKLNGPGNRLNAASLMLRLLLRHNEVFRLPAASRGIEVVAGMAWVTVNGRDIFLALGEKLSGVLSYFSSPLLTKLEYLYILLLCKTKNLNLTQIFIVVW